MSSIKKLTLNLWLSKTNQISVEYLHSTHRKVQKTDFSDSSRDITESKLSLFKDLTIIITQLTAGLLSSKSTKREQKNYRKTFKEAY
jgi:hypothetical protein